jgi:hypothetical protein
MSNALVPLDGSTVSPISSTAAALTLRQPRRVTSAIEAVQLGGAIEALTDDLRHRLALRAMENVAMLSAIEGHYVTAAPLSEQRIKAIVDAYALAAATAVQRFGR